MTPKHFTIARCKTTGIEAIAAHSSHSFHRHSHDQFGIGLMCQGAQKSLSGRGIVEAEAGNLITVNPGEIHDGSPIGDKGRTWQMLYFNPQIISDFILDITEGKTSGYEFTAPVFKNQKFTHWFKKTYTAVIDGICTSERDENILHLLSEMMGKAERAGDNPQIPHAAKYAQQRIDDDPSAPISLADLASETQLSRFQILRSFKKLTGFTPHAYLLQRRIQTARQLIASGTSLAETAVDCGFVDQSHMTRVFVKNFGFAPGLYAKAIH